MRVLIIEDDPEDMSHICNVLTTNSHQTVQAKYGSTGLQYARQEQFDAIVLDRMLGNQDSEGQNGLDILHTLRKEGNKTPVLILSALGDVDQRVVGLHRGADDYLPKPFEISELLARLVAIVRSRNPMAVKEELVVEDLVMNLKARTVQRGKKSIRLTALQFRLLEALMRHSGDVVTRKMLMRAAWPSVNYYDVPEERLNVHIHAIRSAIDNEFKVKLLHTVNTEGYTLRSNPY